MDKTTEQKICLKSCGANEILCAESLKMFGNAYEEVRYVEDLFNWIDRVREMVLENFPRTLRELAHGLLLYNISHESVRAI